MRGTGRKARRERVRHKTVRYLGGFVSADDLTPGLRRSLRNVQVIPPSTPVVEVVGAMRNFASALGVRCQHCHVGEEGAPLSSFDLASDARRNKLVARQMMRMVAGINRRLDTIPERPAPCSR